MMWRAISLALAVAIATATPAMAEPTEEDKKKASARFTKGVELYNAGDIRAALIEFRRAYKLAPTYRLLFNIGQASAELKDYVDAYESFVQYLADGGSEIADKRREMVEREIARLKTYLAQLRLTVSVDGAEVTIDGISVGVSPLPKQILVSAGRRSVVVTKTGYARWERFVDLAGEDERELGVDMVSLTPVTPPDKEERPVTQPVARRDSGGLGGAFWASAATTAAFAIGTGVVGALALGAQSDLEDERSRVPATQADIDDASDRVKRLALITDVGIGVTAAAAIVTIVLAVRSSGDDNEPSGLAVGPTGVSFSTRF